MTTFNVAELLKESLADVDGPIAVALSGGVDSTSCLFALQQLGKDVRAYTFHVKGVESTDFQVARNICDIFDVPFNEVILPNDLSTIKQDVYTIIQGLGYRNKTDIECIWPFLYLLPNMSESTLVTGSCADGHFVISREGMLNYRDSVEAMDKYRSDLFSDPDYAQIRMVERIAKKYGIDDVRVPYFDREFVRLFMGTSWDEINKPNQKQPIIDAYPELFAKVPTRNHSNLQMGDSKIQEQFEKLINSRWNIHDYDSPVGIYNSVARGEVP